MQKRVVVVMLSIICVTPLCIRAMGAGAQDQEMVPVAPAHQRTDSMSSLPTAPPDALPKSKGTIRRVATHSGALTSFSKTQKQEASEEDVSHRIGNPHSMARTTSPLLISPGGQSDVVTPDVIQRGQGAGEIVIDVPDVPMSEQSGAAADQEEPLEPEALLGRLKGLDEEALKRFAQLAHVVSEMRKLQQMGVKVKLVAGDGDDLFEQMRAADRSAAGRACGCGACFFCMRSGIVHTGRWFYRNGSKLLLAAALVIGGIEAKKGLDNAAGAFNAMEDECSQTAATAVGLARNLTQMLSQCMASTTAMSESLSGMGDGIGEMGEALGSCEQSLQICLQGLPLG